MKKLIVSILLICLCMGVQAQRVYFIYLQSDNGSPFFARLGDKIFSSSAAGYMIIPQLKDSTYQFTIGTTGAGAAEARFSIPIGQKDKGFLLRHSDEGLSLFNLQELSLLQPVTALRKEAGPARTDSFTQMLSAAANDPSLLTISVTEAPEKKVDEKKEGAAAVAPVVADTVAKSVATAPVKEEPAQETAVPTVKDTVVVVRSPAPTEEKPAPAADSVTAALTKDTLTRAPVTETAPQLAAPPKDTAVTVTAALPEPSAAAADTATGSATQVQLVPDAPPFRRSVITKRSESSTTEGFGLVFLDTEEGKTDTIRLVIPNPKFNVAMEQPVTAPPVVSDPTPPVRDQQPTENAAASPEVAKETKGKNTSGTGSCGQVASESDFFKLRRNMAAASGDEAMITAARKVFRNKCFTTEQVRNLATLFLTDDGRYHFLDAAYGHVTDPEAFSGLGALIRDAYFSKRFHALIGQ